MDSQAARAKAFKSLHQRVGIFAIPNPWDAGSASILAELGFEALATTSAGFAFSVGRPDAEGAIGLDGNVCERAGNRGQQRRCRSRRIWRTGSAATILKPVRRNHSASRRHRACRRVHRRRDRTQRRSYLWIRLAHRARESGGESCAVLAFSIRAHRTRRESDQRAAGSSRHDSAPGCLRRGGRRRKPRTPRG